MDFNQIKELLKGLITDSTPTEDVEKISKISIAIEEKEKDEQTLINSNEDLRKKYIAVIKDTSFKGEPKRADDPAPKSLEECMQEVIAKRKEK